MRVAFTKIALDWRTSAAILAIFLAVFIITLPLATALQFGPDEGMELTKALIYAQHSELTPRLWNDQPALFTEILSIVFKIFTPTILAARLVTVAFSILICLSLWGIAAELAGEMAGVIAVLFFVLSPHVPTLLVSTMLEIPAFSLAMASLWLLMIAYRKGSARWLAGSALLYGCALNIKLTPVVLLPAFFVYGCITRFNRSPATGTAEGGGSKPRERAPAWKVLQMPGVWLLAAGAVFIALLSMIPPGLQWGLLWKSHVAAGNNYLFRSSPTYAFKAGELFLAHPEAVLGSIIGYYVLVFTKQWRALLFLTVWVGTMFVVHTLHRPWWFYYYLHFAIPMALLSGIGLQALFKHAAKIEGNTPGKSVRALVILSTMACLLMTMTTRGLPRFAGQYLGLRHAPKISESALLKTILLYKEQARWLYSLDAKYSFFSQIASPPELAVLPIKRFYSGAISFSGILEQLKKYQPEEVLITSESERDPSWGEFLGRDYTKVYEKNGYALHISKKAAPQTAMSTSATNSVSF